ncbi:14332_t:CDS:2, partial [Dentiscutata heterogama]
HSRNILVHEGHAKLSDFGISRQINAETTILVGNFGRLPYIDPKILYDLDYPYDKRSDIYSFGVLMWEISSGQCPFCGCDPTATRLSIIDGKRENQISDTPEDYRHLYVDCWNGEPQYRPEIDKIVRRLTILNENQNLKNEDDYIFIPLDNSSSSIKTGQNRDDTTSK